MPILLTNIKEDVLNKELVNESFDKIRKYEGSKEITEIFYLQESVEDQEWEFSAIPLNKYEIAMDKQINDIYSEIAIILDDVFIKDEFVNVIVDTSFLAYIILEIIIKKFKAKEVFIVENHELKKAHPCSCGSDEIGIAMQ